MRLRRAYADGPFGQIHFQSAGEGRPLVLLHQAIMASGQFDNVFAPLVEAGLRPIAIDMPGFGLSDAPASPPSIADYALCVAPVLDALGLDKAAVAGHHTGALVGTEFALAAPDRVEALIIHGPMIMPDDERQTLADDICGREKIFTAEADGEHFVKVVKIRDWLANGTIDAERMTDYVVQAMQAYRMGAYWYGHAAAFAYRHEEPLARLSVPTMLLSNTGDMTHPWALQAREMFPHFAFAQVEGGGIDICDQAPQEWAQAIITYLQGLP